MHKTWQMRVQSLGREDPPEKEMATHSSILAWEILCLEEPGGLQCMQVAKSQTWLKHLSTWLALRKNILLEYKKKCL